MTGTGEYFTGNLLVAMPGMPDPRFEKSVIYMCAHSEEGAMGLILNQLVDNLDFDELLDQLEVDILPRRRLEIHLGGPVESARGFVLHSTDYMADDAMQVNEQFALSASVEILREIAAGRGPAECLLAIGYAGWGPGQLEAEVQDNGWLTVPADKGLVFKGDVDTMWQRSLAQIGVDVSTLSTTAGRA